MRAIIRGIVEEMRTQPLALALVIVNVLYIAVGAYVLREIAQGVTSERQMRNDLVAQVTQLTRDCRPGEGALDRGDK